MVITSISMTNQDAKTKNNDKNKNNNSNTTTNNNNTTTATTTTTTTIKIPQNNPSSPYLVSGSCPLSGCIVHICLLIPVLKFLQVIPVGISLLPQGRRCSHAHPLQPTHDADRLIRERATAAAAGQVMVGSFGWLRGGRQETASASAQAAKALLPPPQSPTVAPVGCLFGLRPILNDRILELDCFELQCMYIKSVSYCSSAFALPRN